MSSENPAEFWQGIIRFFCILPQDSKRKVASHLIGTRNSIYLEVRGLFNNAGMIKF